MGTESIVIAIKRFFEMNDSVRIKEMKTIFGAKGGIIQ